MARVVVLAMVLNAALVVAAAELLGLKATAWALVLVELFVMTGNILSIRSVRGTDAGHGAAGTPPVADPPSLSASAVRSPLYPIPRWARACWGSTRASPGNPNALRAGRGPWGLTAATARSSFP